MIPFAWPNEAYQKAAANWWAIERVVGIVPPEPFFSHEAGRIIDGRYKLCLYLKFCYYSLGYSRAYFTIQNGKIWNSYMDTDFDPCYYIAPPSLLEELNHEGEAPFLRPEGFPVADVHHYLLTGTLPNSCRLLVDPHALPEAAAPFKHADRELLGWIIYSDPDIQRLNAPALIFQDKNSGLYKLEFTWCKHQWVAAGKFGFSLDRLPPGAYVQAFYGGAHIHDLIRYFNSFTA